jgi:N-acetylmuramoyl-L-alanine amidase
LVQNTFLTQSLTLAGLIQNQFAQKALRTDRGVKQAGFLVLWKTTMPSVLVEVGFISNPDEEKFLRSVKGQELIASSIFRAFRDYKNQIENRSVYAIDIPESLTEDTTPLTPMPADTNLPVSISDTIEINTTENTTAGTEYYLQITASQNKIPLNSPYFKGINNISELSANNTYKYIVGAKKTYEDAVEYSKIIKNYFPDAFIVAVNQGKIIPLKEALKEIKN